MAELNYLKLSRLLHPDFQAGVDEPTQGLAVRNSALLNEAWKTLNDDQLRSEYLLELYDPGVLERHKTLSPEFLMEAMEVSEELDDAQIQGCKETIRKIAGSARSEIETRMKDVASACSATIARIAHEGPEPGETLPAKRLNPHDWNTDQIAVLLHQARVYRRILRDTENAR
jgi:molecular chaperone HscB